MLNVDLRLLQLLNDMIVLRSNAAVAEKRGMTPQAVSLALNRLRETLGDPLFTRSGQGWEPTPYANEITPVIRGMLQSWYSVLSSKKLFDPSDAHGLVTIGCSAFFDVDGLARFVARIKDEAPNLRIDIDESTNSPIDIRRVREGALDMVCTHAAPEAGATDLHSRALTQMHVRHICCSVDHPVIRDKCGLDEYANAKHLLLSSWRRSPTTMSPLDEILMALGYPQRKAIYVQSFLMYAHLLENTDLIASNSDIQVNYLTRNFRIKAVPLPFDAPPPLPVFMIWGERTHLSPLHAWLRNLLREAMCDGPHHS